MTIATNIESAANNFLNYPKKKNPRSRSCINCSKRCTKNLKL